MKSAILDICSSHISVITAAEKHVVDGLVLQKHLHLLINMYLSTRDVLVSMGQRPVTLDKLAQIYLQDVDDG